jgi:hypothetical protein
MAQIDEAAKPSAAEFLAYVASRKLTFEVLPPRESGSLELELRCEAAPESDPFGEAGLSLVTVPRTFALACCDWGEDQRSLRLTVTDPEFAAELRGLQSQCRPEAQE